MGPDRGLALLKLRQRGLAEGPFAEGEVGEGKEGGKEYNVPGGIRRILGHLGARLNTSGERRSLFFTGKGKTQRKKERFANHRSKLNKRRGDLIAGGRRAVLRVGRDGVQEPDEARGGRTSRTV